VIKIYLCRIAFVELDDHSIYKELLNQDLEWLKNAKSAKRSERVPVVLTKREVESVLSAFEGVYWVTSHRLYAQDYA
jgi:hypothetical protein